VTVVLVVTPSPKFQKRFVIVPLELSVKVTVNGLTPRTGLPTKLAAGTTAPMPATALVLLPALPLVITTTLLKLEALEGAKRTTRLVEPKPVRLKGVPEMSEKEVMAFAKTFAYVQGKKQDLALEKMIDADEEK